MLRVIRLKCLQAICLLAILQHMSAAADLQVDHETLSEKHISVEGLAVMRSDESPHTIDQNVPLDDEATPLLPADGTSPSVSDASTDERGAGATQSSSSDDSGTTDQSTRGSEGDENEKDETKTMAEEDEDEEEEDWPSMQVIGGIKRRPANTEDSSASDADIENQDTPSRHKGLRFLYPSLLSTLKTILSFLVTELVEEPSIQEETVNVSDLTNQSVTSDDGLQHANTSANSTDTKKKKRFQCAIKNVTVDDVGKVRIVNSSELLDILNLSKSQKSSACVLVLFYAPWCTFCAKTAPHFNALARAFPQLDILAVDTSHFSYLNARFGTVAVPNIMLFHSRAAVRFNHTQRSLDTFTQFVKNNTGLEPRRFVLLEPLDFVGPLPCLVQQTTDWLLLLAWVFVATCGLYGFVCSRYGQGFITKLRLLWQEHQHID